MQGLYDSSLLINLQSVELSRQTKDSVSLAKTLFNTGTSYRMKGEYENAVRYYEEGKMLLDKFGDVKMEAQVYDVLQVLFLDMKQYNRAVEYGEMAVAASRKINYPMSLGISLNNLGLGYQLQKNAVKAKSVFNEALDIAIQTGDKNLEQSQYLNLGDIFLDEGDYEKMKPYMDKALKLSRELQFHESELIALKGLSSYYTFKKNFPLAGKYAREACLH